jgi:hypothetical protein
MIRIEEFILSSKGYPGRPIEDRAAIARAFVAEVNTQLIGMPPSAESICNL